MFLQGGVLRRASEPLSARRRSARHRPPALELGACSWGERYPRSRNMAHPGPGVGVATRVRGRRSIERVGKLRQAKGDCAESCPDGRQRNLSAGAVDPLQKAVMRCRWFESPYLPPNDMRTDELVPCPNEGRARSTRRPSNST